MNKNSKPKVLLLSMPWTSFVEPSLGLGILKAQLNKKQITCKVRHFNLFLLKYLSVDTYVAFANLFAINDSLFTCIFESEFSNEQVEECKKGIKEAIDNNLFMYDERYTTVEAVLDLILKIRNEIIPDFLLDCLNYIKEYQPTMIGFTCMFDQTIASLALAKLVKEYDPTILIVLGGYSVGGDIGRQLMKSFDYIDCIALGAGEFIIENLAEASINKNLLESVPNICYRNPENNNMLINKNIYRDDINKSPCPDYDDFLSDLDDLSITDNVDIQWKSIPIETSRGCWWGEKKHCVFCGIDEETIRYSYKKEEITMADIIKLREKYNKSTFRISDYILPFKYYDTFLDKLAEMNKEYSPAFTFACEIKSNVKKEHFQKLAQAGFEEVQPGIESFSSNILKKMNKGVSAIHNIYCLMLGMKYSIRINYNFLYGFPDDEIADYEEMLKIIPHIYHLAPPSNKSRVIVTRDSPIQQNGKKYGFEGQYRHHPMYNVLFSESFMQQYNFDLDNYCYYFENPFSTPRGLSAIYMLIDYQIRYWTKTSMTRKMQLYYKDTIDGITFFDSRYNDFAKEITFDKTFSTVYKECECLLIPKATLVSNLQHLFSEQEIENTVRILIDNRFIYEENNLLLGLAFNENIYTPSEK